MRKIPTLNLTLFFSGFILAAATVQIAELVREFASSAYEGNGTAGWVAVIGSVLWAISLALLGKVQRAAVSP